MGTFMGHTSFRLSIVAMLVAGTVSAQSTLDVEGQPLAANVRRLLQALDRLGAPLSETTQLSVLAACNDRDVGAIQRLLDPHVLLSVNINPEVRVKAARGAGGAAKAVLQQAGYTPVIVKIVNDSTATHALRISSPQAGPPYAGMAKLSMTRQDQLHLLLDPKYRPDKERFLHVEMFNSQPMTANLSGLRLEYALALIYASEAGKREATIGFDIGQGTQDLGFRAEVPVLFDVQPAVPVKLAIADYDGQPTVGRFTFRDKAGHIHPPQARRLAPDLFFQEQIYRDNGDVVLLPPGEFTMYSSRGPEYRLLKKTFRVPFQGETAVNVQLERWIDPAAFGFYSGDHHIHAAGCAHYTSPTEGVSPRDMYRQVKGEGLNVGCLLTWGPCYDYQRQFFEPVPNKLSEPFTVLKYDLEVSGFGSQALGHVCLLNLRDQTYPGSAGRIDKGWPTWTTPLMRWAKAQGAITGYAHSASGLQIDAAAATRRLIAQLDTNGDGRLSPEESDKGLLPEAYAESDSIDHDGFLSAAELRAAHERAAGRLPNVAIPELNSVGAQEVFVTTAQGLCDFISAMDTARIPEWNCWYHLMNCGFPLKVSGETDFPCMSGARVGQGRVYVQLGKVGRVDFVDWCAALAKGRSYVSDGYAHAVDFTVNGKKAGDLVHLTTPAEIAVRAKVAFASATPLGIAHGLDVPPGAAPLIGDTVTLHGSRVADEVRRQGGMRKVELIVNGKVTASTNVPADDKIHEVSFSAPIERSSWVALRHFPQMHTNPVNVLVAGRPIRPSRQSALWCVGCIEQLWRARGKSIAPAERDEAHQTFLKAIETYRAIAAEAPPES